MMIIMYASVKPTFSIVLSATVGIPTNRNTGNKNFIFRKAS